MSLVLGSPEFYTRLATLLAMVVVYRLGNHIPIPGTQTLVLDGTGMAERFAALLGSDTPANIFILSVGPLMNAHLVMGALQLLTPVKQHFAMLHQQGQEHVVQSYTTTLFFISAFLQAAAQSRAFALAAAPGRPFDWRWLALSTATMMAGSAVCRLLCSTIEEKGLGDGLGVFIATGTALGYSRFLWAVAGQLRASPPPPLRLLAALGLCFATVAGVVYVQGLELRLPLAYHRARGGSALGGFAARLASMPIVQALGRARGGAGDEAGGVAVAAAERHAFFPIALCPQGTRTLLFVNFWVSMFQVPLNLLGLSTLFNSPWAYAALIFLVEAPNIGDTSPQLASYLAMGEAGVTGISPGTATAAVLSRTRQQLRLLNAGFLAAAWLSTAWVDAAVAALVGAPAGCLQLLLLVSIFTGGTRQLAALATPVRLEAELARERALMGRA